MPSLTELSAASSVATGDQLAVNQSGTDRRITAGTLFGYVTAALQTFTQGIAIGVASNRLYRPTAGVLRQRLETVAVANNAGLYLTADSNGRGMVYVYHADSGRSALFVVDGGVGAIVYGSTSFFAGDYTAGRIVVRADGTPLQLIVSNQTGASATLAAWVIGT